MTMILPAATEDYPLSLVIPKEVYPYLEAVFTNCDCWTDTLDVFVLKQIKDKTLEAYYTNCLNTKTQENWGAIDAITIEYDTLKTTL